MGNRQKAQRDKFYQQKQQKLLSTIKDSTSFCEPSILGADLTQKDQSNLAYRQSFLGTEWVESAFIQIKEDIIRRISTGAIQLKPPKEILSESQSFISDDTVVSQFLQLVTSHLDIYEQGIKKMITQYNQEMKMEQITKKQWDEFCSSLEKASFISKKRYSNNKSTAFSYQQYGQSVMSEASGRFISTASCENLSQFQSQNKNSANIKLMTIEDIAVKREIRGFRLFLMASQESFVLFQRVVDQFCKHFKEIYGEEDMKVQHQFLVDPWQMERRIEMDIFFIISLNECFVGEMMNHYCREGNISVEQKASLMHCIEGESKTLPIINMLFVSMKPVFNRIRFLLKATDQIYKRERLLAPKLISEIIQKKHLQMLNISNPYSQSITQVKNFIPLFNKNPFNAVQLIKSAIKPLIFKEVEEYKQSQISNNKLNQNPDQQSSPKGNETSQEYEEFQLSTDGAESTLTQKTQQKQISLAEETSRNNQNEQPSQGLGADELIPIYTFIITKAESEVQSTLYFDLKIFNIVFSEVQDRVSSFSEHIFNATNLLQSYFNIFTRPTH